MYIELMSTVLSLKITAFLHVVLNKHIGEGEINHIRICMVNEIIHVIIIVILMSRTIVGNLPLKCFVKHNRPPPSYQNNLGFVFHLFR